ncbi:tRNA 2-thiocytidine(32) synthetase TtcA [candidate division KSB1 bacterium]|nr:tRNA 2-thiocytidine(32) synthetase TtcA [candidate division KSB1 bacterium]
MTQLHIAIKARLDKAIREYNMLADHDAVLVAVSGGADSMALLELLSLHIWTFADDIRLCAVYIDLGFGERADERCDKLEAYFKKLRVSYRVLRTDIGPYAHSEANRERPCFLCSRLRRRKIFEIAQELGCNKIAFGHHKDDIIETLLMNMIWNREISTMIPNLAVFHGKYHVLRPLVYVDEVMIKKFCSERRTPTIEQECPTDGHSRRQFIKQWLGELESRVNGARENIFASMKRVKTDYLL